MLLFKIRYVYSLIKYDFLRSGRCLFIYTFELLALHGHLHSVQLDVVKGITISRREYKFSVILIVRTEFTLPFLTKRLVDEIRFCKQKNKMLSTEEINNSLNNQKAKVTVAKLNPSQILG